MSGPPHTAPHHLHPGLAVLRDDPDHPDEWSASTARPAPRPTTERRRRARGQRTRVTHCHEFGRSGSFWPKTSGGRGLHSSSHQPALDFTEVLRAAICLRGRETGIAVFAGFRDHGVVKEEGGVSASSSTTKPDAANRQLHRAGTSVRARRTPLSPHLALRLDESWGRAARRLR